MVNYLNEDSITVSANIIGSIFSEKMIYLHPIEDNFLFFLYLTIPTHFTWITVNDLKRHEQKLIL